jgi:hypothetical protein
MRMRQPQQLIFLIKVCIILILFIQLNSICFAQQTKSYIQTRKLLLRMERGSGSSALKKLFEESDKRMPDLVQALYDEDQIVSLNSQTIIRYLADEKMLADLENWYEYRRKQKLDSWVSPVKSLPQVQSLKGTSFWGIENLVLKNVAILKAGEYGAKNLSAQMIAYNRKRKLSLIRIIEGETFTTCWHIVIRQTGKTWQLLSDTLVWQS